jgi:hypothetical protein
MGYMNSREESGKGLIMARLEGGLMEFYCLRRSSGWNRCILGHFIHKAAGLEGIFVDTFGRRGLCFLSWRKLGKFCRL